MREYALIGEYNTWKDWGLNLVNFVLGLPSVKKQYVTLPLESVDIDLSESVTGRPSYGTREIKLYLGKKDRAPLHWTKITSQIASAVHGKKLPIAVSFDPDFYYIGRISCETQKISYSRSKYLITATCEPYKYRRYLTEKIVKVEGTKEFTLINMDMPTSPLFTAENEFSISCNNEDTHIISPGTDVNVPEVLFLPGNNTVTLQGNGNIKIRYQEGVI